MPPTVGCTASSSAEAAGRQWQPTPTDPEKIALFTGMGAYAGTYTIEGDKVSHHVDVSWNEAWTGTTQVRQFRIDGNTLQIRAEDSLDGRLGTATLVWTKVRP